MESIIERHKQMLLSATTVKEYNDANNQARYDLNDNGITELNYTNHNFNRARHDEDEVVVGQKVCNNL